MESTPGGSAVPPATLSLRVAAIIPAVCEEQHIGDVVRRTRALLDRVLVVDDGSIDETSTRARAAGAEVIVHPLNRGKGDSIKSGLNRWQKEADVDYMIVLDADGQHLPEEIARFIAAAERTRAKMLIGTRMNDVSTMPLLRRLVNRFMSGQISRLCGQAIPDTQCGFRMIHRDVVPDLLGGADRFDYETEMLIIASRKGIKIEAVPITTVYADETSSISPVRDTLRFFRLMRRYRR